MKVEVEVREQTVIGASEPTLDEIVVSVDGKVVFHLEQMSDQFWWMGVGDTEGQYVHCHLYTKRAEILGLWEDEGREKPRLKRDGKEVSS